MPRVTVRENIGAIIVNKETKQPYGNIKTTEQLGGLVRACRKEQQVTQAELAALCSVGVRFISDLENGKQTIELGKTLHVLRCLGLDIAVTPRNWEKKHQVNPQTIKDKQP
jgi:y4mF family transcriptional regulator